MEARDRLDMGLLLLRIGLGCMFIAYGLPMVMGGPEKWEFVGKAMSVYGVTFAPKAWGLAAAITEFGGGIALILGLLFRPACAFLLFVMFIAASMHLHMGQGFLAAAHAIDLCIVFVSLLITGPGRFVVIKSMARKLS